MTNKRDEPFFKTHMSVPQLFVRNARDHLSPNFPIGNLRVPIVPDMTLDEITQRRRHPCRRMNAIRDVRDRNFIELHARKDLLPERARNFSMLATDAVGRATHANRERRQSVALRFVPQVNTTERKKFIFSQSKLFEIIWSKSTCNKRRIEFIIARRNRRVRCKNTLLLHSLDRSTERLLFRLHDLSCELEREKSRVAFVQMKHVRRHAELAQQPHTANT